MIKVGDKIKVRGDENDFTTSLDGKTLTVIETCNDEDTTCPDSVFFCEDERGFNWYIKKDNILEVEDDG